MAVDPTRPEAAVDLIVAALRATISGTERSYPPQTSADVIDDDPWQRYDWNNARDTLYFVFLGSAIIGEKRTTGTQDENVLVTVLAGHRADLSRPTNVMPLPSGVQPWRVKARLQGDVKRQLEAALRAGMIPGTVVEDLSYMVNINYDQEGWDAVHVEVEVRYRRQRGEP